MIVIRIFLWLIIIGIFASPVVAWYGLEDEPLVTRAPQVDVKDINSAKKFLAQYDPRNIPDGKITVINANQSQINTALAAALAAAPFLKARIVPSRFGLLGAVTAAPPIPSNPFGKYVNIRMLIESSTNGLQIGRLSIGEIEVPTAIVRPVFILVIDHLAGPGRGVAFLETIRSVQVNGPLVRIVYQPKDGLLDDLKSAAKDTVAAGDPEITRVYWQKMHEIHREMPIGGRVSMVQYLQPLFELAKKRSAGGNPVEENKAAIFAMSMFLGDIRLERFIGKVREKYPMSACRAAMTGSSISRSRPGLRLPAVTVSPTSSARPRKLTMPRTRQAGSALPTSPPTVPASVSQKSRRARRRALDGYRTTCRAPSANSSSCPKSAICRKA